jgi:hypothetical protein
VRPPSDWAGNRKICEAKSEKKEVNRTKEAGNRIEETTDAAKDKATEIKNHADSK